MITRLVWTIWTPMSAVPKKAVKLNQWSVGTLTHSLVRLGTWWHQGTFTGNTQRNISWVWVQKWLITASGFIRKTAGNMVAFRNSFPPSGEQPEDRKLTHEFITTNCWLYSNISQILLLYKTWVYYNKFDSVKSLGGILLMCQNTTMQVNGAWIKTYYV